MPTGIYLNRLSSKSFPPPSKALPAGSKRGKRLCSRQGGGVRLQQRELQGPTDRVRLSDVEQTLLTAFLRAPSGRLENWQLLEIFSPEGADVSKTNLEVRIARLRKKLSQAGAEGQSLEAIRGVGYQLHTSVQLLA